jgi:hypothetical protein
MITGWVGDHGPPLTDRPVPGLHGAVGLHRIPGSPPNQPKEPRDASMVV